MDGSEHHVPRFGGVNPRFKGVLIAASKVLADFVDDDTGRIAVAAERADVEIVRIEGNAHALRDLEHALRKSGHRYSWRRAAMGSSIEARLAG